MQKVDLKLLSSALSVLVVMNQKGETNVKIINRHVGALPNEVTIKSTLGLIEIL
jgi:hypothetical protein